VAFGIDCPELIALRRFIAAGVPSPLTAQDAGWRWPHVTVQNKVEPAVARRLAEELLAVHRPRPVTVTGLGLWRYLGGPWEPVSEHRPPAT
jgi:hypothetical protein